MTRSLIFIKETQTLNNLKKLRLRVLRNIMGQIY